MSVSAEDKERLYRAMVMVPVEDRSVEAILRVLDELEWGPGGVSARPDREALARELAALAGAVYVFDEDATESDDYEPYRDRYRRKADRLLAVEHLWTQPASEAVGEPSPSAEEIDQLDTADSARDLAERIGALTGAEVQALSHKVFLIVSVAAHLASAVQQDAAHVPSVPVVDRDTFLHAIEPYLGKYERADSVWHAVKSAGLFEDRATVEREAAAKALEATAERWSGSGTVFASYVRERLIAGAAEYREGRR